MAALTEEMQEFIVQRLAMYDTPQVVANAVYEEFGQRVTRQQVEKYDATRSGPKPAEKWCKLFEATRERFKEEIDEIPIAQRVVRLRRLNRMAEAAESKGNFPLAAALMKQAAEDSGGSYTNRREITGKDGRPLMSRANLEELSEDELATIAQQLAKRDEDATP